MSHLECYLELHAKAQGDNPAIIRDHQILTYEQLYQTVNLSAHLFKENGINEETRVGIFSPNNTDYLITLLTLWKIKAIACLFSTRLPIAALKGQIDIAGCQFLLTPLLGLIDTEHLISV